MIYFIVHSLKYFNECTINKRTDIQFACLFHTSSLSKWQLSLNEVSKMLNRCFLMRSFEMEPSPKVVQVVVWGHKLFCPSSEWHFNLKKMTLTRVILAVQPPTHLLFRRCRLDLPAPCHSTRKRETTCLGFSFSHFEWLVFRIWA